MSFYARSAADRTDDWPFWLVSDESGLNVTVSLVPQLRGRMPFLPQEVAERVASRANEEVQKDG